MTVLIDINHPAHVHFFKNLYWLLIKKGHNVIVTASRKEMAFDLLNIYQIPFIDLGSYGNSVIQKACNVPVMAFKMRKIIKKFQPDILMGIASSRICHGAIGLRKKTFIFTDTEHAKEQIALFKPFATNIITPDCFINNLGLKQIRYSGYHELAYLHPNRFKPNPDILKTIGLNEKDIFFLLRFVSWNASHDIGQKGLSLEQQRALINILKPYGRIIISSETILSDDLEKYRCLVSPIIMHDLMYYATLLYGESATMASECAVLGTHAIFVDYAGRGYTTEQEKKYFLVYNFKNDYQSIMNSFDQLKRLIQQNDLKKAGQEKRNILLQEKIDVTQYIVDLLKL